MARRAHFDAGAAAASLTSEGGFSQSRTGRTPSGGYMVSTHGSEKVVAGTASPREIEDYAAGHGRGRGRYIGGWLDEGKTYLDESRQHTDRRAAMRAGIENAQLGVYDLGRQRSINPFGAGIRYRGTLFENLSRNARKKISDSNARIRVQEKRRAMKEVKASTSETDPSLKGVDTAKQSRQMKLPGVG